MRRMLMKYVKPCLQSPDKACEPGYIGLLEKRNGTLESTADSLSPDHLSRPRSIRVTDDSSILLFFSVSISLSLFLFLFEFSFSFSLCMSLHLCLSPSFSLHHAGSKDDKTRRRRGHPDKGQPIVQRVQAKRNVEKCRGHMSCITENRNEKNNKSFKKMIMCCDWNAWNELLWMCRW